MLQLYRNIKTLREQKGMTQAELAEASGYADRSSIAKIEGGIVDLPRSKIETFAKIFGVSPSDLMGWDKTQPPTVTEDVVSFPILGDVAAGYGHIAAQDWTAEKIDVPRSYLKGRPASDYFALRVKGDSMFPAYQDGDVVLVLRQEAIDRSGQIGVVIYDDDNATLKKIEYAEDWLKLVPVNPNFPPVTVKGEQLEHCRILGVPRVLIREVVE